MASYYPCLNYLKPSSEFKHSTHFEQTRVILGRKARLVICVFAVCKCSLCLNSRSVCKHSLCLNARSVNVPTEPQKGIFEHLGLILVGYGLRPGGRLHRHLHNKSQKT